MVERIRRARVENWSDRQLCEEAVELASEILAAPEVECGWVERCRCGRRGGRGMEGREFVLRLAERILPPRAGQRAAAQLADLVHRGAVSSGLAWSERGMLLLAAELAPVMPDVVMPLVRRWVCREAVGRARGPGREAARLDLGVVGGAVLGTEALERRLASHVRCLKGSAGVAVTVSLGAMIPGGIRVLAFEDGLGQVREPLRRLFRSAMRSGKLVTLESGGFSDLGLMVDAFRELLEEDEFSGLEAGVTLRSCYPESFRMQKELTDWARQRVAEGGAPVRLRLEKGGAVPEERAEASRRGWQDAAFGHPREVDANFLRMVHYACRAGHAEAVGVGVGCAHLCDLAWALLLRAREGVEDRVEIEIGDGVAQHQARVLERLAGGMLVRVPVLGSESVEGILACLERRLGVASGLVCPESGGLFPEREQWRMQRDRFVEAWEERDRLPVRSRREQNREIEYAVLDLGAEFRKVPDTDWTREENRDWIGRALAAERSGEVCDIRGGGDETGEDPGDPGREICRYGVAGVAEVERALSRADAAWRGWGQEVSARRRLLREAACGLSRCRDRLIAALVAGTGKSVVEADREVSTAVDLANYLGDGLWWPGLGDGVSAVPLGVVVVVPPWDAPLSGACGAVLAALMGGNAVVLSPPAEAVLVVWRLAEVLWESGVSKGLLQFLPVKDGEAERLLVTDGRVEAVVWHGRFGKVAMFMDWKPEMRLMAATGGKSTMLVTGAADRDRAVRDLVESAFGQAGQQDGAVFLAILEEEIHDDPEFLDRLRDAAASLRTGPGWDLASTVTPLIGPADGDLERALTRLDPGEEWLLRPEHRGGRLWSPGIRTGVRPESWFARTPCRGPVLGLVQVAGFEDGLRVQQDAGRFGLAAGLQSLDQQECALWKERVMAGQVTVNGALGGLSVGRQPTGAWRSPGPGPMAHVGGPNVVGQLVAWREEALPTAWGECPGWLVEMVRALERVLPEAAARFGAAAGSYALWWTEEFGRSHDRFPVVGESNEFRYRSVGPMICRVDGMAAADVGLVCMAARRCGVALECSGADGPWRPVARAAGVPATVESASDLVGRMGAGFEAIRVVAARPALRRAAFEAGVWVADGVVMANGRLELRHYLREQAVRTVAHRGHLRP